jgi:cytoskeletal protein CcmA (bactofilin family)
VKSTVISADMKLKGDIDSIGLLVVMGHVHGKSSCEQVYVAPEGQYKGSIKSKQVSVAGVFDGQIKSQEVLFKNTAIIDGEVNCKKITIEDGAVVNATISMNK